MRVHPVCHVSAAARRAIAWRSRSRWANSGTISKYDFRSPNALHREGDDTGAREKMVALRGALLRLHKSLLDMERRDYEREHGVVNVGELFRLVVDDPQFSWLHNISEFVVRIDETLTGKAPVAPADADTALRPGAKNVYAD